MKNSKLKTICRNSYDEYRITIPTFFTIARIIATPFIVLAIILEYWRCAFIFFVSAALTDVIDGMLARMWNEKTFLGACLDPIADKFLLISCFSTLSCIETPFFKVPYWFALCILIKEAAQLGGTVLVYRMRGYIKIQPTLLGKVATCAQVFFIIWIFACYFFNWRPLMTYYSLLVVMLILMGLSFWHYVRIGIGMLTIGNIR